MLPLPQGDADGSSVMIALNLGCQPVSIAAGLSETIEGAVDLRGNEGMIIDTSRIYAG